MKKSKIFSCIFLIIIFLVIGYTLINSKTAFNSNDKNKSSSIVKFPDRNLEKLIRKTINKPKGDIYKNEVEEITLLYASDNKIKDISGIENLKKSNYITTG